MESLFVVKRSGEKEPFDENKVRRSMKRVGVPENMHNEVLAHIKQRVNGDGEITTDDLFRHILEFLEPRDRKSSIRFNLRDSIFQLGPTGFPFEQYLARIFEDQGYKVQTGLIMNGDCVKHEIDLLIEKDGHREIIEAKFHNHHAVKSDVQTALYTYARFLDVKEKNHIDNVWLITNTKLTSDAIAYCNCKGIPVIGWNYPDDGNLQDFVEKPQMYPITILNALSEQEKRRLIEKNVVLCRDLLSKSDEELSDSLIQNDSLQKARDDAKLVCPLPQKNGV